MKDGVISSQEFLRLEALIINMGDKVVDKVSKMFIPKSPTIAYVANTTGMTKQAIQKHLYNNFESGVDFILKNGKIILAQETALTLIKHYGEKNARAK